MRYSGLFYRVYHYLASIPPKIAFKTRDPLTQEERQHLIELFARGYYIILTGNNWHLSSLSVKVLTWIKTGKWTRYSHALMNCDYVLDASQVDQMKFMEATVKGVHFSPFDEVFDCDSVCILSPAKLDNSEWSDIIDALVKHAGRPYDDLFQLADASHISCVELVRNALKADYSYDQNFINLERLILREGNLVPQMFRDCEDFRVVYENS